MIQTLALPAKKSSMPRINKELLEGDDVKERRPKGFFSKMKDDELIAYAQKFIDDNNVVNLYGESGLEKRNGGLCNALWRRKLIGRLKFKEDERKWNRYLDDEIVNYAQKFIDDNKITHPTGKGGLQKRDSGLFNALYQRKLLEKLKFEGNGRKLSKYSDDELVAHAQKFIDDNNVVNLYGESGLEKRNGGLYGNLRKRKLIGRLKFKEDERKWNRYLDDEIVNYAQKFIDENKVSHPGGKGGLHRVDRGLFDALYQRKLLKRLKFKDKFREWKSMNDDELVAYAQKFIDDNKIPNSSGKGGLQRIYRGLYEALRRRKLLNRVFAPMEEELKRQKEDKISRQLDHAVDAYLN